MSWGSVAGFTRGQYCKELECRGCGHIEWYLFINIINAYSSTLCIRCVECDGYDLKQLRNEEMI